MAYYTYVSLQDDDKILVFTMDPGTGKLTQNAAVPVSGGPAAMAIDPERRFLYVGRRGAVDIASFSVDQADGGIAQIGSAPLQGVPATLEDLSIMSSSDMSEYQVVTTRGQTTFL